MSDTTPSLRPFTPEPSSSQNHSKRRGSVPSNLRFASSPSTAYRLQSFPPTTASQSFPNALDLLPFSTEKRRASSTPSSRQTYEDTEAYAAQQSSSGLLSARCPDMPPLLPSISLPPSSPHVRNVLRQPRELLSMVSSLVRNRQGSVLSRNLILKADHFPAGKIRIGIGPVTVITKRG